MSVYEKISGFADEISQDFDQQLKTVTDLGMKYICIRSAEHKGIADYTPEEVRTVLLPKLQAAGRRRGRFQPGYGHRQGGGGR